MLRASRARVSPRSPSRTFAREQAKESVAAAVRHARDAKGSARAGTTLYREALPSELGACSGDEMSEDEHHWFIDNLVWGPYQDALGQEVFLARVSGINDYGEQVDGILWEHQRVDIPAKLIHTFMEHSDPDMIFGQLPPEEWVTLAEAYANAKRHLLNYDVEVEDSDAMSLVSDEDLAVTRKQRRRRQTCVRRKQQSSAARLSSGGGCEPASSQ